MEKIITIDGKQVKLKSTGATPKRYRNQFGKDLFAELLKMGSLQDLNSESLDYNVLQKLDMEVFFNLTWVFAKTADKSIPEPEEWLDEFDTFPVVEIIPQIQDLIESTIQVNGK